MLNLFPSAPTKEKYIKKEIHASRFIPYKGYWNQSTIITKNNQLLKVIKLDGFSFETADDEDLDIRKNIRNSLFKNITSGNITLYFHTIRRNKGFQISKIPYHVDPTVPIELDFNAYLEKEWNKKYSSLESYVNELYITVLYTPDKSGVALLEYLYKKLMHTTDKSNWAADMVGMYSDLDRMVNNILNSFRDLNSRVLRVRKYNQGYYCEIIEFLSTLTNAGFNSKLSLPTGDIDKYITSHRLFFGEEALEIRGASYNKYGAILSIAEYSGNTFAGIFDGFLQMPFEFIMTQSYVAANRASTISKMQLQQNRMIQSEDKAVSQIAEISQALDLATSGTIAFGDHHFSILCIADSLNALEHNTSVSSVELSNYGIRAVREKINLEPSYWGQLPGNNKYIIRKSLINTLNLASYVSIHNYPPGQALNNHWGEFVTVLKTTSRTSYYFNFHVNDVGHTLIIGPTGAGKTVLLNFLCAQAQKFAPRMFLFDKDHGAEIFVRAIGGKYTVIDPGTKCNFNPLQLPDTGTNRSFLLEWLKMLVSVNKEQLTAEDIKLLNLAIDGNYRLNKKDRKLSNIASFFGMATPGSIASRIEMWYGKGSHANIFDNDVDDIDLSLNRNFGFEMGNLLKDTICLSPVLSYIFHRIQISLKGEPSMIVLDEAWALIDNPVFGPKIKDWLKILRKLNTFVIFATQSVEDAAKSSISDTLIQQTATQIFLPNLKATDYYKTAFMLTNREYNIIKTTNPSSRYFLIKQAFNAVIAKIDLEGLDDIIAILSGNAKNISLLHKIIQKYGENPKTWLPIFYQSIKNSKEQ